MLYCLWRTLLQGYFRVMALSVASFLSILLITRFKAVARFAALSGDLSSTALFTAYQFPFILPIAIPLSALIASYLLFQRLSRTFELMALRASGLSFARILAPILFAGALLTLLNFSISAEMAPYCRRAAQTMLYQETSANPLLLLQRQQLVKLKHAYLDMDVLEPGVSAKDVVLITFNEAGQRLNLFSAKELNIQEDELHGSDTALFTHLPEEEGFDTLLLENQASLSTAAPLLSQFLKKHHPRCNADALSARMLLLRHRLETGKASSSALLELLRRSTLALAVFSFTLLGSAFAIENGRLPSRKSFLFLLGLTLLLLFSYLTAKELKKMNALALLALSLPHLLIWVFSFLRLHRISRGDLT